MAQFEKGNAGGPGRGHKKPVPQDPWEAKQGRTAQETLDKNKNDFLAFCFRQARNGNNFIAATLLNKLLPNGTSLGAGKGLPEFESMSVEELERIANDEGAMKEVVDEIDF